MNSRSQASVALASFSLLAVGDALAAFEGDNWWIGGRVKQGVSIAYDLPGQSAKSGPANFLAQIDGNWQPSDDVSVTGSFWLRGDLNANNGPDTRQGGIQDLTSAGFRQQAGFNINGPGSGFPDEPFGANQNQIELFDDFNEEVIRELSMKYKDPDGRYSIKFGKFQRGWGQSDGLRLLDVLHAQDLRERFVLRDAEDTRIPSWMASLDLDFQRMGIAGPFESLGMERPALELVVIPEVNHSRFIVNNPTPSSAASGGIWGFPFPRLIDSKSNQGLAFIGVDLGENEVDSFELDNSEFGARFKFEALGADWTINGFYGQQDLPVVALRGSNLIVGSALNNPVGSTAIPLDVATTVGAAHAPGQYLDYLRSLPTGPIAWPLGAFGCNDPAVAAPNCSLNLDFDLDYDYRQKMLGFSFTREMSELKLGPKNVSPVMRLEFAYEFDKPFNRAEVITPFGELETGTTALVIDPGQSIVERDQWSLMVGFDYFLWLPFWEDQRSSIFTSVQLFNIHTDGGDELLYQAPYSASGARVPENHNYATFLWNVGLMQEKLFLEGLSIYDEDFDGFIHRQRIDFNFFGDKIRPRLEWVHVDGDAEQGVAGLFGNSDYVEASITVQF